MEISQNFVAFSEYMNFKALSYTVLSYTGLADAQFLIGFQYRYVVKTISCSVFWWSGVGAECNGHLSVENFGNQSLVLTLSNNSSYTNFDLHRFFSGSKNCASQGLTVNEYQLIKPKYLNFNPFCCKVLLENGTAIYQSKILVDQSKILVISL